MFFPLWNLNKLNNNGVKVSFVLIRIRRDRPSLSSGTRQGFGMISGNRNGKKLQQKCILSIPLDVVHQSK